MTATASTTAGPSSTRETGSSQELWHSHYDTRSRRRVSSLRTQIDRCSRQCAIDSKAFVPEDCIRKMLTLDIIKHELRRLKDYQDDQNKLDDLAEKIVNRAGRIFLILTSKSWPERIISFIEHGLVDGYLPIKEILETETGPNQTRSLASSAELSSSFVHARKVFQAGAWTDDDGMDLQEFCNEQWKFLIPVFDNNDFGKKEYDNSVILPFESESGPGTDLEPATGGFSRVVKVKFHHAHLIPEKQPQPWLALKQSVLSKHVTPKEVERMFESEIETLKKFRDIENEHLIYAITAFKHGKIFNIVFPWAECGNLRDFWQQYDDKKSQYDVKEVLDQLRAVFHAINDIHTRGWRHGDLKPENILCFTQGNNKIPRFVIADVGLAKFHHLPTNKRSAKTNTITGTRKYEPPDVLNTTATSRVYDIWSMGCICLESIIWLLSGYKDGVVLFNNTFPDPDQRFWAPLPGYGKPTKPQETKIRDEVMDEISRLKKNKRCLMGTALGNLLTVVEVGLLVIEIESQELPSMWTRVGSKHALDRITEICNMAKLRSRYLDDCAHPRYRPPMIVNGSMWMPPS